MRRADLLIATLLAILTVTSCATPAQSVAAGVRAPTVASRVEPEYPAELRAAGIHGSVVIAGTVPKEGGTLRNARVIRSDDARLEPLALDAVSRWIWRPGLQDGQPVDVEFSTTVTFSTGR